jgi:hypothetical protein
VKHLTVTVYLPQHANLGVAMATQTLYPEMRESVNGKPHTCRPRSTQAFQAARRSFVIRHLFASNRSRSAIAAFRRSCSRRAIARLQ